jgi:3-phosphoshikimate 1-carboxyvinyltransferase
MDIRITPSKLSGTLDAISSKSFAHRLLICAALSENKTRIHLNGLSDDIQATINCLQTMGCFIETKEDSLLVTPLKKPLVSNVVLNCKESGSTARFLFPLAAHLFDNFTIDGSGNLPSRPFSPICNTLANAGCVFTGGKLPITGRGKIKGGDFFIDGNISSQFISGLLFTLPLLDEDSRIIITTSLESAAYVDMTIEVLSLFGIEIKECESGYTVKGNQEYKTPHTAAAEGDWSNAAFFLCIGALGGLVSMQGLSLNSTQGDKEVMEILRRFGANAGSEGSGFCEVSSGILNGISIDASQIPDLVPVLAAVASVAAGETKIFNAQRLRLKESDRIQSTFDFLSSLGADVKITDDGLIIHGKDKLKGGTADSAGDHRIVMAAAAVSCVCENPVIIKGCEAVNKSYPSFFDDFKSIGGAVDVI